MKKGIIAFAALATLGIFTGCGNKNQVVCSGKVEEDGQSYEAKIVGNLKDGKVSDGYIEMTFSDKKNAETYCGMLALTNSFSNDDSKKIDYECKDKTIRINTLELDEDDKFIGLTKDEFIKAASDDEKGVKCK